MATSIALREERLKMPQQKKEPLWIVVYVHSGVVYEVKAYRSEKSAERRANQLRREMNEDEDDLQVVEIKV
jgi:hypothetical protein